MAGSTCSFLSGAMLCLYATLSHLYRANFPRWVMVVMIVISVGIILAGCVQLMIERWAIRSDSCEDTHGKTPPSAPPPSLF